MTVASGGFAELLWPGIMELWGLKYARWDPKWSQVFEVRNSDKAFEKFQGVTGLPLAGVKQQGSPIPYADPFQGFPKEMVHVEYALGASVTRVMFEDDQYNYINMLPEMLAESLRQTEETVHFNVLNNAFVATVTGPDGVSLANSAHPMVLGGTTQSNIPDTATDLTMTAVETAFTDIMDLLDDNSLKINLQPKTLVIPTALWAVAEKIMGTDRAVGSADNDINVVRGSMKTVVSPWLTDPDAWFVLTTCPLGLISLTRRAAEIDRDQDFDTQNLKFVTLKRFSASWVNWRQVYASAGA